MKKNEMLQSLANTTNKLCFSFKKNSPEIFVVAGVTGVVISAIAACFATRKLDPIIEETKDKASVVHDMCKKDEEYENGDAKKDLIWVYANAGLDILKLYGPALIIGSLSITGILVSNNILRKRNAALAAAYTALDQGFKQYRKNVVEKFGEKVDHDLKYGIKSKKFEKAVTDENGKTKKVKETAEVSDENLASPYATYFTKDTSFHCENNKEYNMMFLRAQQTYANDLLRARGHLFLNEVYDSIEMKKRTKGGQVVGWIYNEDNPTGDNFVDLGITTVNKEVAGGGYEEVILIDPNVDGDILDSEALNLPKL